MSSSNDAGPEAVKEHKTFIQLMTPLRQNHASERFLRRRLAFGEKEGGAARSDQGRGRSHDPIKSLDDDLDGVSDDDDMNEPYEPQRTLSTCLR